MRFKKYKLSPRVINDLKKRSFFGICFYPVILYLVLFTSGYHARHPEFSTQFMVCMLGICFFRLVHWPVSKLLEPVLVEFNNWVFLLSVLLTAFFWGIGFVQFMLQSGESSANLMMVICTIGLAAGGTVAYVPYFRIAFAFDFFMLVPGIVVMLIYSNNIPLVTAFTLMFLYLCFMAYTGNKEYWDALENEDLLEKKSDDLEKLSRIDGLTGLYNRRYFDEVYAFEWNRSLRKKQPLSIIMADIDDFKGINDQYGHLAGDEYLKATSRLLRQVFKRKIDIIARYGGEEFIVLMPGEPGPVAYQLAQQMCSTLETYRMEYEGTSIKATLSLGVANCIPEQNQKNQSLISKADDLLYQSKARGRNCVSASK